MNRTLKLAFVGFASAVTAAAFAQTISVAGPFSFVDLLTGPEAGLNTVVTGIAPVTSAYQFGASATVNSINLQSVIAGTFASEASVRLVNSGYPALSATINFSTATTYTTVSITSPTVRSYSTNSLNAANIALGSNWTLTFFETFEDGAGADSTGDTLSMVPGVFVPPPPAPPALPVLFSNGTLVNSPGAGSGGADLSIIGTEGTGGTFGSTVTPAFALADDFTVPAGGWTVAAVSGYAYQTNATTTTSPYSGFTVNIWNGDPSLPTSAIVATSSTIRDNRWSNIYRVTSTTLTNTARAVYRIEAEFPNIVLPAGTYYAAYQATAANGGAGFTPLVMLPSLPATTAPGNGLQFNVTWGPTLIGTPATFQPAIPFLIHGPLLNQNLTGSLVLGDTSGAFAFNRNIAYSVKQGTSTVASGTITASASSTPLSISVPATVTGASQLVLDGSSFLKRVINVNLTGSNQAVGSATMQNGDVDNSGEVDAVDIDLVIASFGLTTNISEDVDVSGEVDAVDIDIVIANFGGVDQ